MFLIYLFMVTSSFLSALGVITIYKANGNIYLLLLAAILEVGAFCGSGFCAVLCTLKTGVI
jgi:hypothetical protein